MDANDAAVAGALPGDVKADDLKPEPVPVRPPQTVPGGATDPIWYFLAHELSPHTETTRKRGWVEGFVAALETARGLDADDGVAELLRQTIGLEVEVPVAVRQPTPFEADAASLGRFLFERQALTYDVEDADTIEEAWGDPGVQEFWLSEARAILRFLP